jgi:hypothetical protein
MIVFEKEMSMPLHDWNRVPAGLFHHFHQDWSIEIARMLNRGQLPDGLSALVEQRTGRDQTAYVEPIAVGDSLPDMPLFLTNEFYVSVQSEVAYETAWSASPKALRTAVETGIVPQSEVE